MNDRSAPVRVMFVITSMPVGGAETLLVNLVRRFDRTRVEPMICCLKDKGVLGEEISKETPVFDNLIHHKFDVAVTRRLKKIFQQNKIDAVITVGAGDKMFWGRLAAKSAKVPVVLSALHSTGWPDGVGRLNRLLTRITDGFIAVADSHARFLVEFEKFPEQKVFTIPNGIDTERFQFDPTLRSEWRAELKIDPQSPVVGIVAALRPEKNHSSFLNAAAEVLRHLPDAHFVIAGDGPEKPKLVSLTQELGISRSVHFLGTINDVPGVLSLMDLFALTSDNEAKPVSILEAMACERPVVATNVGSVSESVIHDQTGLLVPVGETKQVAESWVQILADPKTQSSMGKLAREHVVENSSLDSMTEGYMRLVEELLLKRTGKSNHESPGSIYSGMDSPRIKSL